jgi:thymidylate synthase ThyX
MLYSAQVLADSEILTPTGDIYKPTRRCITIEVTFPRFILAEVNTHRAMSRNSASSRAIPTEKLIANVKESPFVPLKFNKRVKGMGVGEELADESAQTSRQAWLWARDQAVKAAEILLEEQVDKSRANRLLEPFMEHTAIITGTTRGWDNFFALRYHKNAQPEFELTARVMLKAMLESDPKHLEPGEWALPLVTEEDIDNIHMDFGPTDFLSEIEVEGFTPEDHYWPMVSASRCARVSYDTHENFETVAKSMERAKVLVTNGHLSPLEHVVRAPGHDEFEQGEADFLAGNLLGFVQLRKLVPYDWNRVGYIEGRMSWEEMEIPEIPELIAA